MFIIFFNPFTATSCKVSGLKSAHSIVDGPITNLLSMLYFLIEAHGKGSGGGEGGRFNDFKSGTLIGRLPSDGMARKS